VASRPRIKRYQAAVQAKEIFPLIFLVDDSKTGSMTQDTRVKLLHGNGFSVISFANTECRF